MNINLAENSVVIDNDVFNSKSQKNIGSKYCIVKRIADIFISLITLVILSPLFLIISILIKLDSKGPVFFVHKRLGREGKYIYIYKFRTMVENAEDLIKEFTPEQMKIYKENFKLEHDPRVTKIGKILRKTSIDELPQLINILKGDLSLIGPRPIVDEELKKYKENKDKFLSITPGLTGYWAANGRSCVTYKQRIEMELFYIDNISLKLDIEIFFQTIIRILKREGAV